MITIHLNGEAKEIPEDLTLAALLTWLKIPSDRVAIEHNLQIVPRDRWGVTPVRAEDRLEVVHLVGGGAHAGVDCRILPPRRSGRFRQSRGARRLL